MEEEKRRKELEDEFFEDEFDNDEDFSSEGLEKIEEEIILDDTSINVAIIGRVNVGKSSILNALVGMERSVVSSIAGTTIDPVDETFSYKDKEITFVDTAGLEKRKY
ncbi:hypothetical protein MASR2M54_23320 [Aliarcobacter cryaerophilus]